MPLRTERVNWSVVAVRVVMFLRIVRVLGGTTVTLVAAEAMRPVPVTVPLVYVPGAAARTLTVIVQLVAPAARSPPTAVIEELPDAAVTAKAVPVTLTQVPPTDGVGATTRPAGRDAEKPQSGFARRSLRLVIV